MQDAIELENHRSTATATAPSAFAPRVELVDTLRGLMIVLMVFDHTREFFHAQALLFQPTDIDQTNAVLFGSRWVTHLCAPTFVFLSGVSIWLQRAAGKRGRRLSMFLLTRGLWLIVLELTVVVFALNFQYPFVFLQVIFAIGAGMVLMAGAVWLPRRAVLAIGLAILVLGQAVAFVAAPAEDASWRWVWSLLVQPGPLGVAPGFSAYPALPWFAIMAVGYGAAPLFLEPVERRDRRLVRIGLALIGGFLILRLVNVYGDFPPWRMYPRLDQTVMSFLNVSKYPPSLMFTMATLGVALSIAPFAGRIGGPVGRLLDAYGRAPLFVYVLHLYVIHTAALLYGLASGYPASQFTNFLGDSSALAGSGWGVSLAATALIWVVVVIALWPAAAWFAGVKARRRGGWASYL